jgi:hypothetical protein
MVIVIDELQAARPQHISRRNSKARFSRMGRQYITMSQQNRRAGVSPILIECREEPEGENIVFIQQELEHLKQVGCEKLLRQGSIPGNWWNTTCMLRQYNAIAVAIAQEELTKRCWKPKILRWKVSFGAF